MAQAPATSAPPPTGRTNGATHSAMDDASRARADTYAILASLLHRPPTRALLDFLAGIETTPADDEAGADDIGQGWRQVRVAAAQADIASLDDEYHNLFIGLGRGEVVPFASWHLTGFLMEQPLSDLRDDLKALGIEPATEQKDPEDHIAAVCEAMALIIRAGDIDETREQAFFSRHIHSWAGQFFTDLQAAKSAQFYKSVGFLGRRFVEFENRYLNIETH